MIKFVVCEDHEEVMGKVTKLIAKKMMAFNFEYKIHRFNDWDNELIKVINDNAEPKVYILDIEMPHASGLDIARKIREEDWMSIIIIVTAHNEMQIEAFKQKSMILDFISKFDNYEEKLSEDIDQALKILNKKKVLIFQEYGTTFRINLDNILYITKDKKGKRCTVFTNSGSFNPLINIKDIEKKVDKRFYLCHRSYLVNVTRVDKVDAAKNIILFDNGTKLMPYHEVVKRSL